MPARLQNIPLESQGPSRIGPVQGHCDFCSLWGFLRGRTPDFHTWAQQAEPEKQGTVISSGQLVCEFILLESIDCFSVFF